MRNRRTGGPRHPPGWSAREASRLLDIPARTIGYWAETSLIQPSVRWLPQDWQGAGWHFRDQGVAVSREEGAPAGAKELYDVPDLVRCRVARDLLERKVHRDLVARELAIIHERDWRRWPTFYRPIAEASEDLAAREELRPYANEHAWLVIVPPDVLREVFDDPETRDPEEWARADETTVEELRRIGACRWMPASMVEDYRDLEEVLVLYALDERAQGVVRRVDEWLREVPAYRLPDPMPPWM